MKSWFVIATGPSVSQKIVDKLKPYRCVAVSNAHELAPWADAMCSTDKKWWQCNPKALEFKGRRFSVRQEPGLYERIEAPTSTNSGLLGVRTAVHLGATRIFLVGFDMQGSHYFGRHPEPLYNTTPARFEIFKREFADWQRKNKHVEVLNATPYSGLTCFQMVRVQLANGEWLYE